MISLFQMEETERRGREREKTKYWRRNQGRVQATHAKSFTLQLNPDYKLYDYVYL